MTLEQLTAYVRTIRAQRKLTVADYINIGRAFIGIVGQSGDGGRLDLVDQ